MHLAENNERVNEIMIDENGIQPISNKNFDTVATDAKSNAVLYSYSDSAISFWYKIRVEVQCEITFDIFPTAMQNTYNFFLYDVNADITPDEIIQKKILPIRANLCKDNIAKTGTGLSAKVSIASTDMSAAAKYKNLYHTAYHSAIHASPGNVYILNVFHISGTDCGHRFDLKANNYSWQFQCVYRSCYEKQLPDVKYVVLNVKEEKKVLVKPSEEISHAVPSPVKEDAKVIFTVTDSVKHSLISADIACVKNHKNFDMNNNPTLKEKYEILLDKNSEYQFTFSAFGYKSRKISFSTKDSTHSFSQNVFLSPCKEGDNFVMDKIYFYPNTYAMKPGSLDEIDKLLQYLKSNPEICIEIQGHTNGNKRIKSSYTAGEEGSFTGSSKKLSQCRADVIKRYLIENGIAGERLISHGYGGSNMIYPDPKNQEQANKNIRVAIQILSQKDASLSVSK